ncbi:unnamed protein product [Arctia plantaginis]|uniref:Uncharacterized protein n=1 Tax=Arctia plantaginis TaxID=874455 RepID=A0A8S1AUY8_ARCPL|nr:unnamed protein product [Arctia plantaginis]
MARLTSVDGGFVQLTANDDTVSARSVAASHARSHQHAAEASTPDIQLRPDDPNCTFTTTQTRSILSIHF